MADKALHNLIHRLNPTLKIAPNREFFEIEPWDALELLQSMAIIHNRLDKLVRYKENKVGLDPDEEIKEEYTIEALIEDGGKVKQLYERLKSISKEVILDYTIKPTKNYIAFKRNKKHNIISLWPKENAIEVVLNAKLGTIKDESGTMYDISNRLWSSAQYAFRFDENSDEAIVKNLILQTYQNLSKV
jgi:predicted transport protein